MEEYVNLSKEELAERVEPIEEIELKEYFEGDGESIFAESFVSYGHQHFSDRAPWLRATVLGAMDGIVSISGLAMGVEGGTPEYRILLLSMIAGVVAGAISMASGEYISVSSQRDAEQADILKEQREHGKGPTHRRREFDQLVQLYLDRGMSEQVAKAVAIDLTKNGDPIAAHLREELGIDITEGLADPKQAAFASFFAFLIGGSIPFGPVLIWSDNTNARIAALVVIVLLSLGVLGAVSAHLGGASKTKAAVRVIAGGLTAMGITYLAGYVFITVIFE